MASGTIHKSQSGTRLARMVHGAKTVFKRATTTITDPQSLVNIHNMVNARDDIKSIQDINRDMFRITKDLKLFHTAFGHKRETALVVQLQYWMHEIDKRCTCAKNHLEIDNATSDNLS